MLIRPTAGGVVVLAPAKLNLSLEVLARRSDGYHELETLVCPVDLYDTLVFSQQQDESIELKCRWAAGPDRAGRDLERLPTGADNLAVRAVELLRARAGVRHGARMRLIKRIPTAAGLGGGSSDAAAALAAANRVWQLGWSPQQLGRLGAELGSDVPLFLAGGPAVCRGRGEDVTPIGPLGALGFVLVRPPAGLSTPAVYAVCRPAERPQPVQPLIEALRQGRLAAAGRLLVNRLQPAAESLSPWIERLKQQFQRLDCLGHGMSGSGTAYFGLCRHPRHARRLAATLRSAGVGRVFAVHSCR